MTTVTLCRRFAVAAFVCFFALAPSVSFGADEKKPNSLGEKTSEAFQKLRPLLEAKNWDGILTLLNSIPNVAPESYDRALILDTTSKIYMNMDQLGKAIAPLEGALKLADAHGYFPEDQVLQSVALLSRLIYNEAVSIKDRATQQKEITRAAAYLKRFLQATKAPKPDDMMFYAQLLYGQAASDPAHLNQELLREAADVIQRGMLTSIKPTEGFYQILIALFLQQSDYFRASELLELVVAKFPEKKDYWPQLMAAYLQLAGDKDEKKAREYYVRAINTIERAQSRGIMTDSKNNYNLVSIYIATEQYNQATALLYAGLKKGTIESSSTNWRILGSYYQQANKEVEALEALQEAAKLFPDQGTLELQIGEIYRSMEKTKEAREHYRLAIQKGNLDKPHIAYQLLAFAAVEFNDLDEALQAITAASKFPAFQSDKQMQSLKQHIENTINERNEAKKAKEAGTKKSV